MRRSADSDHRSQGNSAHEHAAQRNENIRSTKYIIRIKTTVRYIGQRDPDGKSVSRNRILCFIFFTQILHSSGENFTIGRYYENR